MIKRLVFLLLPLAMVAAAVPVLAHQTAPTPTPVLAPSITPSPTATQAEVSSATPVLSLTPVPTTTAPSHTPTPLPVVVPLILHEPTPVGQGPQDYGKGINPLTGQQVADSRLLERRPIIVKVTNYPRTVRPQSGLSKADIVYEYYMERGITRFAAIFYGQDAEKVGPVRSARFFDEHIFRMYDGIFVFGSADRRVLDTWLEMEDDIVKSFVLETADDRDQACDPDIFTHLCRDQNIHSYNNLFTDTGALTSYIDDRNGNYQPDLNGMRFTPRTPLGGEPALNIYLRYSLFIYNRWAYSLDSGRYLRFQETIGHSDPQYESYAPHIDALTGEQLAADNVVILVVPHQYFVKTSTTEIFDLSLLGEGEGIAFRDGYSFPVTWVRPKDGGVLQLYTLDGQPYPFKPGNTWFEVVSQYTTLQIQGIDWRFVFSPPPEPQEPIDLYATPED